jgi:hypothetical protein
MRPNPRHEASLGELHEAMGVAQAEIKHLHAENDAKTAQLALMQTELERLEEDKCTIKEVEAYTVPLLDERDAWKHAVVAIRAGEEAGDAAAQGRELEQEVALWVGETAVAAREQAARATALEEHAELARQAAAALKEALGKTDVRVEELAEAQKKQGEELDRKLAAQAAAFEEQLRLAAEATERQLAEQAAALEALRDGKTDVAVTAALDLDVKQLQVETAEAAANLERQLRQLEATLLARIEKALEESQQQTKAEIERVMEEHRKKAAAASNWKSAVGAVRLGFGRMVALRHRLSSFFQIY